ncbi:DUF4158 domain-containing protein [Deinococcus roseus]|uniref:DUF4158 domain-containing protein n=1 Tax=Deinococcus roseus TaxID=392414 RepID=A0ABQ2DF19_9DEIO|nr:DUF4158 domain-containing protein [Deinococcus roseus]GGJ55553.1 hypothetical protein GCM10008938_47170 [Deinococcus roseus]
MLTLEDTIYPRLKRKPTPAELTLLFTPSTADLHHICAVCTHGTPRLARLIHLVIARHLRGFQSLRDIPRPIQRHIAASVGLEGFLPQLPTQDHRRPYTEHTQWVRDHLHFTSFRTYGVQELHRVLESCCTRHEDLVSIINAAVEHLHQLQYELPGFTRLVKEATHVRSRVNRSIFDRVVTHLTETDQEKLNRLLEEQPTGGKSNWNLIKQEPRKASLSQLKVALGHLQDLEDITPQVNLKMWVSNSKFEQFVREARSLHRQALGRLTLHKRYTLMVALLEDQQARIKDDLGTLLVKRMFRLRNAALTQLKALQERHQGHTDMLIEQLRQITVLLADKNPEGVLEDIQKVIPKPEDTLLDIDQYQGRSRNNFVPFMLWGYQQNRQVLLKLLEVVPITSTSDNKDLEEAIRYVLEHRSERDPNLSTFNIDPRFKEVTILPLLPLGWVPEVWRPFVFQHNGREVIVVQGHPLGLNKMYFEMCVLMHVAWELRSGDLCIEGSNQYANYTRELVSPQEMEQELPVFLKQMNLDGTPRKMVSTLKARLQDVARWADVQLKSPEMSGTRIKGETFTLSRQEADPEPAGFIEHRQRLATGLAQQERTVLDALFDTEHL